MFGREDLGTIGMNLSVANANFIYTVHQLRDQIKTKTRGAEGGDLPFGGEDYLGVFNRVLKIVFLHSRRQGSGD